MPTDNYKIITPVRNLCCALLLAQSGMAAAVSSGQIDTFGDGTLQGWIMGRPSVTEAHVFNIASGGPAGDGDGYLQIVSSGIPGPGGWITTFNKTQWTGDYLGAGITTIAMDVKNFNSAQPLNLRLGIGGLSTPFIGGLFATHASVYLPSDGDWTHVVFSLAPDDLVAVPGRSADPGTIDVLAALSDVFELRLINSANPSWTGELVAATLGIDNIHVVQHISIDIKPGNDKNLINLKSRGVIRVAILTTDGFDANNVDPDTVQFAGAPPLRWRLKDVDGDTDWDMVFHFKTQATDIACDDTEATLTGKTLGGLDLTGTDSIRIVGCVR